jgi:hypothetical protein
VDYVSTLRYSDGVNDLYFFVNYSGTRSNSFEAVFPTGDKDAWCWDAETGRRCQYAGVGAKNVLAMTLGPAESRLIVFGAGAGSAGEPAGGGAGAMTGTSCDRTAEMVRGKGRSSALQGPWEVTFHHFDGVVRKEELQTLAPFGEQSEWHSFAGTIEYRGTLQVEQAGGRLWLDLGHLRDVSELEVNGFLIGAKWYGEHLYEITGHVAAGANNVTIRVVTTLGNYMKTLQHNLAAHNWTRRTPYYPVGLGGVTLLSLI